MPVPHMFHCAGLKCCTVLFLYSRNSKYEHKDSKYDDKKDYDKYSKDSKYDK